MFGLEFEEEFEEEPLPFEFGSEGSDILPVGEYGSFSEETEEDDLEGGYTTEDEYLPLEPDFDFRRGFDKGATAPIPMGKADVALKRTIEKVSQQLISPKERFISSLRIDTENLIISSTIRKLRVKPVEKESVLRNAEELAPRLTRIGYRNPTAYLLACYTFWGGFNLSSVADITKVIQELSKIPRLLSDVTPEDIFRYFRLVQNLVRRG